MLKKEERIPAYAKVFSFTKKLFAFVGFIFSSAVTLLMLLLFGGFFIAMFTSVESLQGGNIEIIPIHGVITTTGDSSLLTEKSAASEKIVKELKAADRNERIKGIILEINSPGGGAVASYEIVQAVKKVRKPVVAVIRETGASGGFWVATAAEKIFVSPLSVTGSVGVLASHLEYSGLLKRYNVTYRRLVAGKYKDAGSPYREMQPQEEAMFQKLLNKLHEEFIVSVADNRKLPIQNVRDIADGFVLLGSEAKEKRLVDDFGGRDEAVKYLEHKLNITGEVFEFKDRGALTDLLTGKVEAFGLWVGAGIGSVLLSKEDSVKITV